MRGLTDKNDIKEQIVKIDEHKAIRYKVVEETIELDALKQEKEQLEQELNMPEPDDKELIEHGKMVHPYYMQDKTYIQERIEEISLILGE